MKWSEWRKRARECKWLNLNLIMLKIDLLFKTFSLAVFSLFWEFSVFSASALFRDAFQTRLSIKLKRWYASVSRIRASFFQTGLVIQFTCFLLPYFSKSFLEDDIFHRDGIIFKSRLHPTRYQENDTWNLARFGLSDTAGKLSTLPFCLLIEPFSFENSYPLFSVQITNV